jgi:hypothetical protein
MIFRVRAEEGLATAHTNVSPLRFRIRELTAKGRFRSLLARDVVLLVSKLGPPLGIWFLDFVAHGFILHRVSREFTARNSERDALDGGQEPFNNQSQAR